MRAFRGISRKIGTSNPKEHVSLLVGSLVIVLCIVFTSCELPMPPPSSTPPSTPPPYKPPSPPPSQPPPSPPPGVATFKWVSGDIRVMRGSSELKAYQNMPLYLWDEVRSFSRGQAIISFPPFGEIQIDSRFNAVLVIQNPSIFVRIGRIFFRLKDNLPWSTTYVRGDTVGTEFSVTVLGDDSVSVGVREGKVRLTPRGGASWPPVEVAEGYSATIKGREIPRVMRTIQ